MAPEESSYPSDWLGIAERDLGRVNRCFGDNDPEAARFFLQQSLEKKFLKALLLSRGWRLRRVHDLEVLLDDAVEYDPDLERFRPICRQVTGYCLIERYPLMGVAGPNAGGIAAALEKARELVDQVRQTVREQSLLQPSPMK